MDKNIAILHLSLIGRRRFCFSGYENNNKTRFSEEAILPDLPASLEKWESELLNVAFVVNPGGINDSQISQCIAVFYEHDNMDKQTSRDLWRELGLPEPSLQIDTGNRSIHSYWIFNSPITTRKWRLLQSDLAIHAKSDPNIRKPSQPMRLAGFKSPKTGELATIISQSKKYDYLKIRNAVPKESTLPKWYECPHKPGCPSSPHCQAIIKYNLKPKT